VANAELGKLIFFLSNITDINYSSIEENSADSNSAKRRKCLKFRQLTEIRSCKEENKETN
jgi:hypothetical protein